jgi:hypothetical protein
MMLGGHPSVWTIVAHQGRVLTSARSSSSCAINRAASASLSDFSISTYTDTTAWCERRRPALCEQW